MTKFIKLTNPHSGSPSFVDFQSQTFLERDGNATLIRNLFVNDKVFTVNETPEEIIAMLNSDEQELKRLIDLRLLANSMAEWQEIKNLDKLQKDEAHKQCLEQEKVSK